GNFRPAGCTLKTPYQPLPQARGSDRWLSAARRHCLPLVLFALLAAGCGPPIPREDLGEISPGVPNVPGTETPFPLPETHAADQNSVPPAEKTDTPEANSSAKP